MAPLSIELFQTAEAKLTRAEAGSIARMARPRRATPVFPDIPARHRERRERREPDGGRARRRRGYSRVSGAASDPADLQRRLQSRATSVAAVGAASLASADAARASPGEQQVERQPGARAGRDRSGGLTLKRDPSV